jgi:hypothetical protein
MLTAAGSSLVSGAGQAGARSTTTQVRVLRPFLIKGERQEVGAELVLDRRLAVELATYAKVELLKAPEVAAAAITDMKTEPKPARAKKGGSNAQQ